jgi:hypothetical protein
MLPNWPEWESRDAIHFPTEIDEVKRRKKEDGEVRPEINN